MVVYRVLHVWLRLPLRRTRHTVNTVGLRLLFVTFTVPHFVTHDLILDSVRCDGYVCTVVTFPFTVVTVPLRLRGYVTLLIYPFPVYTLVYFTYIALYTRLHVVTLLHLPSHAFAPHVERYYHILLIWFPVGLITLRLGSRLRCTILPLRFTTVYTFYVVHPPLRLHALRSRSRSCCYRFTVGYTHIC